MLKKLRKFFHTPTWLFYLLFAVLILRIPSFFEPYSHGDEMIYLTIGNGLRQGIPLYSGLYDNKPPLLYLVAAIAGNLFWFKGILTVWVLITIFLFWKLTLVLFPKNPKTVKVATIIFSLLTTIPLLEGNIVNAELFMIGPTILGFYILLSQKLTPKNLFLAGISFSVATLFKVPAFFDVVAIIILWLASQKLTRKNLKDIGVKIIFLFSGFFFPILATLFWFSLQQSLIDYINAAFLQNIGYLSSSRPGDANKPFLFRNLPLIIRALLTTTFLLILYLSRKKISKEFIFVGSWLFLTLFAVTFSEGPYSPHYLIQTIGPLSILLSMFFTLKTKEQVLTIFPLLFAFLVPVVYHFWYYPTLPYYSKFIKFISGQMTKEEYFSTFGNKVLTNYKIADFLLSFTQSGEKVFVWGESSTVYALSKRLPPTKYVVDYQIKDFFSEKEIFKILSQNPPNYIVILPNAPEFGLLNNFLGKNYGVIQEINGAQIFKLINPKVRSLMSP